MSERLAKEAEAAWRTFAERIGGSFHPGGLLSGAPRIIVAYKRWTVSLEAVIVRYSSTEHSNASTTAFFRITTRFVGAPTKTIELRRAVASIDSSLDVEDSEHWWGPYYPKNVRRLRLQQGAIPADCDELQKRFVAFCAGLEHLVAQSLAWEDDPQDIVGQKPRWRALIKGFFGSLFGGIGIGLVLGVAMALMIGSRGDEIVVVTVCSGVLTPMLTVPAGLWTVLMYWTSGGKRFGGLYGTGKHRRFTGSFTLDS